MPPYTACHLTSGPGNGICCLVAHTHPEGGKKGEKNVTKRNKSKQTNKKHTQYKEQLVMMIITMTMIMKVMMTVYFLCVDKIHA